VRIESRKWVSGAGDFVDVVRAPKMEAKMSIIDFVKEAGKKLGMGGQPSAQDMKKELDTHKMGTEEIKVDVHGDKAVLTGAAASPDILERAVVAMGNVIGISKVETDVKVPTPVSGTAASTTYTVKKGDTLSEIAEHIYGKGHSDHYKAILEANRPMLKSANKIYPGQVLRIPPLTHVEHRAAS
jgi:LysM repeat protein